jgi:hypothetical protein
MDQIGCQYVTLALGLDRHFEGFVDAYFGPAELKAEVEAGEPHPVDALAGDVAQLQAAIEQSDYDPQRKDFLARQTRAMAAVIRKLSGDQLDFVEEVELYFDITPQMVDEAAFTALHAEIEHLLPGDGCLAERVDAWRTGLAIEGDRLAAVVDLARGETRRRTSALFELPPGEDVSIEVVGDKPWGAYNWYLGHYASRIDLNLDLPMRADRAVTLLAHEAYPGHHTERCLKEYRLYRQAGQAEQAIRLVLAPENVLAEGMAEAARDVIFRDAELASFLREVLYPAAGVVASDPVRDIGVARGLQALQAAGGNAALLYHHSGRPAEEVEQYIQRFSLVSPGEAARLVGFIQNPLWRSYVFNYTGGRELLAPLLQGREAVANFRRLLTEPFTPTQVRKWVAQGGVGSGAEGQDGRDSRGSG